MSRETQDSTAQEPMPNDRETWVSEHIRQLREDRGWNQSELARRMKREGFASYNQMLVSRTEKGDRPIRLNEVEGFARVFGVELADLLDPGPWAYLVADVNRIEALQRDLEDATEAYLSAQYSLNTRVSALTSAPDPEVDRDDAIETALALMTLTPAEITADAWIRLQAKMRSEGEGYLPQQERSLARQKRAERLMEEHNRSRMEGGPTLHERWRAEVERSLPSISDTDGCEKPDGEH